MPADVQDQLRALATRFDRETPHVTTQELMSRVDAAESAASSHRSAAATPMGSPRRWLTVAAAGLLLVLAVGLVALASRDASDPTRPATTPSTPSQRSAPATAATSAATNGDDPSAPPAPSLDLTEIEVDGEEAGTTSVVLHFDGELPEAGVEPVGDVTTVPSNDIRFTTQTSADGSVSVCGDAHFFPAPGNETVDLLLPSTWFGPDALLEPDVVAAHEQLTRKVVTCEPRGDVVQVSIWGAASSRPSDVVIVVAVDSIRVDIAPESESVTAPGTYTPTGSAPGDGTVPTAISLPPELSE